jgi:hypothetical protein
MVALVYYRGHGVPQDHSEAAKWFRRAADQRDAVAQFYLGVMHSEGRGVPQDYAEAVKWYRLAAVAQDAHRPFARGCGAISPCYPGDLGAARPEQDRGLVSGVHPSLHPGTHADRLAGTCTQIPTPIVWLGTFRIAPKRRILYPARLRNALIQRSTAVPDS